MYIYSIFTKMSFLVFYPMVILWLCYGYPMEQSANYVTTMKQVCNDKMTKIKKKYINTCTYEKYFVSLRPN